MLNALLALPLLAALPSSLAATTCNGSPDLCSKLYSAVTFIGTHNSYAVGGNVADNQYKDVTAQLNDGVRTLQMQAHNAADGIHLCHGSCTFRDAGLIGTYLGKVASWVQANPNDVITLVIVNSDNQPATSFASAFESSGLATYGYIPPSASLTLSAWPTLGSMIDSNKRVVTFIDNQASFDAVPYIMDEFSNMWEDAYNSVDNSFGCAVNRSRSDVSSSLMMINHYLDYTGSIAGQQFFLPDKGQLNVTNAGTGQGSIGYHVQNCNSIWGRNPNHILLDFYDSNGDAPFQVAAQLNGVSGTVAAVTPFTQTGSVSTQNPSGTSRSGSGNAAVTQSKLNAGTKVTGLVGGGVWVGGAIAALGVVLGAGML